jgi:hypothetical protein
VAFYLAGENNNPDVSTLRSNATELDSPQTITFLPGVGSFWFKVSSPIAGNVIAALPDVSVIDFGDGQTLALQDAVVWGSATLYQVHADEMPGQPTTYNLVENSTSSYTTDQVLAGKYNNLAYNNDGWQKDIIAPGQSGDGYLNEFYLQVTAEPQKDYDTYSQIGISIPDQGRVLVTPGKITGARDAAWGNWLDVQKVGGGGITDPGGGIALDEYDTLAPSAGTTSWSGTTDLGSITNVSADPTTGQFFSTANGVSTPIPQLTADVQSEVANGATVAEAVEKVFDKLGSAWVGLIGGGYATYVTTTGELAPYSVKATGELGPPIEASASDVALANGFNQVVSTVGFKVAFKQLQSDFLGLLHDTIHQFDVNGREPDIEGRVNDAMARFVTNAGISLAGPTASLGQLVYDGATWLKGKLGFLMGNSVPAFQTFIKNADDTNMTVVPAGHSDRYFGTDYSDWVTINSDSTAYGGGGDDTLVGDAAGRDVLSGGTGNDTLKVSGGDNVVEGSDGIDTVYLPYNSSQVTISRDSDGTYLATTPTGKDRLIDNEKVQFVDTTASLSSRLDAFDTTTNQDLHPGANVYSGPVAGLEHQYINTTSDGLNVSTSVDNWFLHTGSGFDAIAAHGGANVLDGGTNSNFLVGGASDTGDTFFVDDRGPSSDIWSTVVGFHAGDAATVWGVTQQGFKLSWVDNQGAAGYTGLTLHATAIGVPTASLTLAGFSQADLHNGRLSVSFGTDPGSQSPYMYVHANS